ncbi:MAG: class II fructose-bisphosphate aldolase [Candidatus Wildermuthbacteria bacterium]|nr:class II fructose-bisphosphate aldolase [Candidatus Wildermuthbacteria bacterium]
MATKKDLRYYLEKAREGGWALGQFNFSSAEQLKGIVAAAQNLRSPLLLGTSEGDSALIGIAQAAAIVGAYRKETGLPIFLNFDHGKSLAKTKQAVSMARAAKILVVEGELGKIFGRSQIHQEKTVTLSKGDFTNPDEAERFAKETRVDSLAVIFGNVHGVYEQMPHLDFERLQEIKKRVECFLVLHGGSGIPENEIRQAIQLGIVKINISTELRLAFAGALRTSLAEHPEEIAPYALWRSIPRRLLRTRLSLPPFLPFRRLPRKK